MRQPVPRYGLAKSDIDLVLVTIDDSTVILIEHDMDVIKTADHVIDLGPEGGHAGGQVVVTGTPEEVARCRASHTGRFLKAHLRGHGSGALRARDSRLVP